MYHSEAKTKRIVFKGELGVFNRLQSIYHDSNFVEKVRESLYKDLPLVANLRCGLWYSEKFDAKVYFKSTDGHYGNWSFSTNRLNLHLLDIVNKFNGAIIVDSTRKGKKFPDSFSRTIPIWTCVINRVLLILKKQQQKQQKQQEVEKEEEEIEWDTELNMPGWVSDSEKDQVENKVVNKFVNQLLECGADLSGFCKSVKKPLRPIWICVESILQWSDSIVNPEELKFHPLYLVSCSDNRREGHPSYRQYVQGAGDDEEQWSFGLTPQLFWSNHKEILAQNRDYIEDYISQLLLDSKINSIEIVDEISNENDNNINNNNNINNIDFGEIDKVGETNFYISDSLKCLNNKIWNKFDIILNCSEIIYKGIVNEEEGKDQVRKSNYLHLPIREGKIGKNDLFNQLQQAEDFIIKKLIENSNYKILIHSTTGKANCVSITMAIITKYFLKYNINNNNNNNNNNKNGKDNNFEDDDNDDDEEINESNFYFKFSNSPKFKVEKIDIKISYLFIEKYCSQSLPCKSMRLAVNKHLMSPKPSLVYKGYLKENKK
ncbi:hypothetical protein ACTFIW_012757 [Dictyostelium discoideum]